jgi:hypothetical protein
MFGFQRLDVYRCVVTFLGVASTLNAHLGLVSRLTPRVAYFLGLPADGGQLIF